MKYPTQQNDHSGTSQPAAIEGSIMHENMKLYCFSLYNKTHCNLCINVLCDGKVEPPVVNLLYLVVQMCTV